MKYKLFNFRPLLFLAVSVCLGIYVSYLYYTGQTVWWVSILSTVIISLILFNLIYTRKNTALKNVVFSAIFALFFIFSFFNFNVRINNYAKPDAGGFTYCATASVREVNDLDGYTAVVISDIHVTGAISGELDYDAVLYVHGHNELKIGDEITFTTRIYDMDAFYEYRFSSWNVASGIKYTATVPADQITVTGNNTNLFEKVNLSIKDQLKNYLDADEFSVAYAMLCGNSDYIQGDLLENYRSVGVAHIFAVSGLHIGFLAIVLKFILSRIKMNRFFRVFLIISVLLLYSGVCGFSASSLRATIMCATALFASAIGKKYDGLSSVSFAMMVILVIFPVQLFCVGFLLSFGVVLGIILLSRPIAQLLKFMPRKLALSLSSVLSAQITSIPICLYVFKEFSSISIVANLLFVPIVGVLYIFLFLSVILSMITGLSGVFLFLPKYALKGVNFIFGLADYKVFMVGGLSIGAFGIIYYLALLILSPIVNIKRIPKIITVGIMCICAVVGTCINTLQVNKQSYLYVSGSNTVSASIFDMPDENVVVISSANYFLNVNRLIRTLSYAGEDKINNLVIPFNANGVDVQIIMTKIYNSCMVDNVYYLANLSGEEHRVLEKNFPFTDFNKIDCEDILTFDELYVSFSKNGYAVNCEYRNKKYLLVSKLGNHLDLVNSFDFENLSVMVSHDYVEQLSSLCSSARCISYLSHSNFTNGEEMGFFKLKIT